MDDEAVIDASVAFKLIVYEEHTREAALLMLALARVHVRVIAPPLFPFEITNGLHQRVRDGNLTPATANGLLRILDTFRIDLATSDDLRRRALEIADLLGQGSSYDSHYLALAEVRECDFWTADRRFFSATQRVVYEFADRVRWLGDLDPDADFSPDP